MGWQESLSKAKQTVSHAVGKNRGSIENGIDKVGDAGEPPSSATDTEGTAHPQQTPPAAPQRPV